MSPTAKFDPCLICLHRNVCKNPANIADQKQYLIQTLRPWITTATPQDLVDKATVILHQYEMVTALTAKGVIRQSVLDVITNNTANMMSLFMWRLDGLSQAGDVTARQWMSNMRHDDIQLYQDTVAMRGLTFDEVLSCMTWQPIPTV